MGQRTSFEVTTFRLSNWFVDFAHTETKAHLREQPKTHGCLSPTTTEPTPSSLDRPISPSVALSCDRVEQSISGGDGGAAATVHPPHAITVHQPLPEQHQD